MDSSLALSVKSLTGNVAKLIVIYGGGHEVVYKLLCCNMSYVAIMYLVLRF